LLEAATRACPIATLGEAPTWADLEAAYLLRGRQLVECDLARRLAVETLEAMGPHPGAGRQIMPGGRQNLQGAPGQRQNMPGSERGKPSYNAVIS